ncbi:MAG: hypothetical protein C4325_03710 [Blastocatellia bacterium]
MIATAVTSSGFPLSPIALAHIFTLVNAFAKIPFSGTSCFLLVAILAALYQKSLLNQIRESPSKKAQNKAAIG